MLYAILQVTQGEHTSTEIVSVLHVNQKLQVPELYVKCNAKEEPYFPMNLVQVRASTDDDIDQWESFDSMGPWFYDVNDHNIIAKVILLPERPPHEAWEDPMKWWNKTPSD